MDKQLRFEFAEWWMGKDDMPMVVEISSYREQYGVMITHWVNGSYKGISLPLNKQQALDIATFFTQLSETLSE